MNLAIFPLPLILFPGGATRLRIFEPRYIRMIKEAAGDTGFALTSYFEDKPHNIADWATWVKITDFEMGDDGLTIVKVEAQSLLKIESVSIEHDQLRRGQLSPMNHWPEQSHNSQSLALAEKLKQVYAQNPQIGQLYPNPNEGSPTWVCRRWLEIMPIKSPDKSIFIDHTSYQQALDLLSAIVLTDKRSTDHSSAEKKPS